MNLIDKPHSRLGPSGWDRWSRCPGSAALCDTVPNKVSIYAAEGTVAHEVADRVLRGEVDHPEALVGEVFQSDGFDIVVDMETADAVNTYVATVRELIGNGVLMPEMQVPIGHLTGERDAAGTSDCIGISAGGTRLIVIDLKYGKGNAVDAKDNGQGRLYALGALELLGAIFDEIVEVEIVIVQPRLDSVSSEILSVAELREFANEVEVAAGLVRLNDEVFGEGNDLDLNPGEKQCKFCDAKGVCPALREEVSSSLAVVASTAGDFADLTLPKQAAAVSITPEIDAERLAEFLRAVPLIEDAIKGVRAEVERRLFDGQSVPGFYLGVGRKGNRKWGVADIEEQLKKRLGSAAYERKLISVATAEKLFKAKPRTWAKIADLVVQDEGKPSVCKEGDKNPPYALPSADDFTDLSVPTEAQQLLG